MKSEWKNKIIGDLCREGGGNVQTGPFGSQLHQSDYSEEGTPVVMPVDIPSGKIDVRRIARVSESHVQRLARHQLRKSDIVYGRRGDIGRQALVHSQNVGWLCGTGCLRIRLGESEVDSEYLHRYLTMPEIIGWIEGQAVGATMPNLNTNILNRVPVYFPELPTQRKIAAILTAYDDLIEINKRRIVLLEKMAEEIYCEWFVRMRFPGHQSTKFVKGVPEGWKTFRFSEICKFIKGKTPIDLSGQLKEDYVPYVNSSLLKGQSPKFAKRERNSVFCNDGDVLMLMDGSNSGLVFRAKSGIVASTFSCVSMKQKYKNIVFEFLKACREQIISNNTGSAVPHANKEFINRILIFIPKDGDLLIRFNEKYQCFYEQITNLHRQNENLTKTSDLLLPRLISGKLSVEDLDIQFPPSMQEENTETGAAYA